MIGAPRLLPLTQKRFFSCSRPLRDSLVIADRINSTLQVSTQHTISAAKAIGKPVDVLVMGHDCQDVAKSCASIDGVRKVFYADHKLLAHPTAEIQAQTLLKLLKSNSYTHVLAAANTNGKNVIPRVGATLDVQPISEIQSVIDEDTFSRPIYAGNAIQTVKSSDKIKLLTVRTTSFPAAEKSSSQVPIETVATDDPEGPQGTFVSQESHQSDRPELTSADRVISGGRALKSAENFQILFKLADTMTAAVGASRAAVDAGYAPNDMQVGQTGKVVAPKLYLAVGISGAIQHLAGMKDSKVIVAVNNDPEAPIFQVADYGLVGDLFKVVPEMTALLEKK